MAKPLQHEIEETKSQDRIPELHALGLEIKELENERKETTKKEREKRIEAAAALRARDMDYYHCDGVEVWLESGSPKVKVKLDADEDEAD